MLPGHDTCSPSWRTEGAGRFTINFRLCWTKSKMSVMGIRAAEKRYPPHWGPNFAAHAGGRQRAVQRQTVGDFMRLLLSEFRNAAFRAIAVSCAAMTIGIGGAIAQSGDLKAQDQKPAATPNAADAAKDGQRKVDEFAEAAQAINGPAGNPECVWLGRRVVVLMWRDDLDAAFRHLDLYDRFGCPGGHVQAAFRCLTRFGKDIDPKVPDSLTTHVHACWINPNAPPAVAAASPAAAAPAPQPPAAAAPAPAAAAAPAK